ncbi:hypothetical protein BVC80_8961g11 [Macleaya cordata]|uniref:Myc-type n=1 Tax=Macleaya cordata TaxID=56857 RepID=A0A200QBG1_MACCD|nr:hypothetical protein BVC80_8961g11 [Macleaya cordata]
MKTLYSKLHSLLPHQSSSSKEAMSLPDQLSEAANYIKRLEKHVEKMKEKKERLMETPRMSNKNINKPMEAGIGLPQIEISNVGSALQVVVISKVHHQSMFYEIIRVLHEEGAEIVTANFSVIDETVFHTIHSEVGESELGFGVPRMTSRLKKLVHEFVMAGL